ncbi:PAS domain S-box protein [Actinoplanes sp. LDG1-06]|uniref:histidine kinase n=1 Tax=Paractinoplanes ovalisporus TaxID=2810368 RepID=A0ABS2ASK1_9ACTN|nr:PAS domain S-box protein [Actinoplanes ovalisporus]MBM2622809.1 PAS domain S-box protein [Actinoplanes ovalisporus]
MSSRHVAAAAVAAGGIVLTWRKLAHRRDRRRVERYIHLAAILEDTAAPAFVKTLDGCYQIVSPAYEKLHGLRDAAGHYDHEVHPPERMAEISRHDRDVLSGNGPVAYEEEFDGRWYVTTLHALRDGRGRTYAIFGAGVDVTQLRLAESKFRSLLDASPEAMVCVNSDGHIVHANSRAVELFRYPRDEMIGAAIETLVPGASRKIHVQHRNRYFSTPSARPMGEGMLLTAQRKDGSEFPVDVSLSPVQAEGKTMVLAAIQDVTGRRLLQHTNARLAAIVESSNDAIVSKALDGTIETWNSGAERLYGYKAAEMIGHDVTRLLPPDRLDEEKDLLNRVNQGETLPQHETRRMRKDGQIIEVSLSMAPMRDDDGRIIGASTVAHDITARVSAEKRLRVEREQLQMIMAAAADPFFTMGPDGVIREWNRRAEQVFGWPRDEILGRDVTETVLPGRYRAALGRFLDGEWDWLLNRPTEMAARRHDGREMPIELTMWRIRHDGAAHLHAFARDISTRLETEQALAQARDQALETARLKSQFLASMSHEIRTPMNGVIGLTSLLLGSTLDEQQRRYAEGISTAGSALLSVINDVLDFSKLEAGKVLLDDTNFKLRRLVDDVVSLVVPPGTSSSVSVAGECDPRLPATVSGDVAKLRQVLLNLAGNAIKFTAYGRVSISVIPDPSPTAGPDAVPVRFEVRDTGIGIDQHEQEKLFEPFTQADAGTTRRFGGTGLGLAISRDLVELMGGHIGVHSEPGQGSTFWFTVPLRAAREGASLSESHALDGLRVLIVDQDETDRAVLTDQLAAWSMQATGVETGKEAYDILRDAAATGRPIDLVIHDGVFPGVPDGTPEPRTILLTDEDQPDAFTKPLRQSQLYDALVGVLAAESERAPAPTPAPTGSGHVLLVEDNDINRTVALGILATLGYSADIATNGREAVRMAAERPYQLIFMDCLMPEMDGYAATAEIRRREGADRHVPIIALTASALAEDRARCLQAGMDEHIAKPLVPADVAAALAKWARPSVVTQIEERLDQLRGPDPAESAPVIERLLRTMVDRIPGHVEKISQALALDDAPTLRNEAHQLKGIMANIGAADCADACGRLEEEARVSDLDAAVDALAALRPCLDAVREAVDIILRAPAETAQL